MTLNPILLQSCARARLFSLALLLPMVGLAQYSSPMRDVENPAHSPYRFSGHVTVPAGQAQGSSGEILVPPGKRIVIEQISMSCYVSVASMTLYVPWLSSPQNTSFFRLELPVTQGTPDAFGFTKYFSTQSVRLYADLGATGMQGVLTLSANTASPVSCDLSLSGYTINVP
jgi:hypothetical protein